MKIQQKYQKYQGPLQSKSVPDHQRAEFHNTLISVTLAVIFNNKIKKNNERRNNNQKLFNAVM